jgi:hypothetical protein
MILPNDFAEQEVDFLFQEANSSVMSIVLSTLQNEMKLEPAQVQWVVSVYSLSSVSELILIRLGRLEDSSHYP